MPRAPWLAYWAKQTAESLPDATYGLKRKADIQARAWVEFANACRVGDNLRHAGFALEVAFERYQQGTGNPLLLAQLCEFKASYLKDINQFAATFDLLDEAERLYRQVGETHLAGRVLIGRGLNQVENGMYSVARSHLANGLDCLDPRRDPELQMAAQQNLILSLVEEGEFREAGALLLASGLREKRAESPLWLLRLRWIEAMIQAGLGNDETAERAFEDARSGFFDQNLGINAARVSLELAALWLRQGRYAAVTAVAREIHEKLAAAGVVLEAQRAHSLLVRACEEEIFSESMIDSVQDFLEQVERNPRLRFAGF